MKITEKSPQVQFLIDTFLDGTDLLYIAKLE